MTKRRPITECLRYAIERIWSGRIELAADDQVIGQIVFVSGRIAFAVAKGQSETLGTFLWRLGRLTREQLGLIQQRYKEAGGKKRLGALLEESGFMTRPMLRRALLLHTRSAVEKLLRTKNVQGEMQEGNFAADESILFGPEEALPSDWQQEALSEWFRTDTTQVRRWHRRTEDNSVLEPFAELSGYSAAAVVAAEGDILCAHCSTGEVDMQMLAVSIASTMESATRSIKITLLNKVDVLTLDSPGGGLTARWIDEQQRFLVLVLTEEEGNPSLTRYAIKTTLPALRRWLSRALAAHGIDEKSTGPVQADPVAPKDHPFAHRGPATPPEPEPIAPAPTELERIEPEPVEPAKPADPFEPLKRSTTGDAFISAGSKEKER